jgi:hypothetical protein
MMMMARRTEDEGEEVDDRLAEAQAQIESLRTAATDAEARAATALEELAAANEARLSAEAQLAELATAREMAEGELSRVRSEVEEVRSRLSEAAVKYREAKLASAPEVPHDLVPQAESLAEIDEGFEAARGVVGELRERMQEERQSARVPVGSSVRRAPDLRALRRLRRSSLGSRSSRSARGGNEQTWNLQAYASSGQNVGFNHKVTKAQYSREYIQLGALVPSR